MRLEELNAEQKKELKQDVLNDRLGNPSYGELANADELVTDEELEAVYGSTDFTEEDFDGENRRTEMNAEALTDIVYNSLKLDNKEWSMEFDDYNAQVIHLTHIETDKSFKLTISSAD